MTKTTKLYIVDLGQDVSIYKFSKTKETMHQFTKQRQVDQLNNQFLHLYLDIKKRTLNYNGLYDAPIGSRLLDFIYFDLNQLNAERDSDFVEIHPFFRIVKDLGISIEKLESLQKNYKELFDCVVHSDGEILVLDGNTGNYLKRYHSIASMNIKLIDGHFVIDYMTKDFEDCLYIELSEMIRQSAPLKYCKNCGRLFVAPKGNIEYCQRICTNDGKTCAQVGYSNTFAKTVMNDELLHAYTKAYKAHYARMTKPRKRAANMTREEFESWYKEAKDYLEKARRGEIKAEAFYEWLKI